MIESTAMHVGHTPSHPHVERLRRVSIFSRLSEGQLAQLARGATVRRWHDGAIVAGEQDAPTGLYVLTQGQAKVVLFGENGREMTLALLGPGDFYGETSLLEERTLNSNVVAVGDLTLLVIDRAAFLRVLQQSPQVSMRLLREMAARLRRADDQIGSLALRDVGSRLRRALLDLADERGEVREDGVLIRHRPTQQDLANMVGTCRETVSRLLSSMSRGGLVVSRGRTLLLRPDLLHSAQQAA
jgi:CRP/FNR family cyclic AMP-dependent transcriptional regulator